MAHTTFLLLATKSKNINFLCKSHVKVLPRYVLEKCDFAHGSKLQPESLHNTIISACKTLLEFLNIRYSNMEEERNVLQSVRKFSVKVVC